MTTKVFVPSGKRRNHRLDSYSVNKISYLSHVDGIRGLAILLVVAFHIFVGKVSSGVDVFLFIGGLLFLRSQIKNAFSDNGISSLQAVIRILRRLAPSLIVVTLTTTLASLYIYPPASWKNILVDSSSAVGYWINWRLGITGQDYASANSEVSPFQHLWSMSAQMQIYMFLLFVVFLFAHTYRLTGKRGGFEKWKKSLEIFVLIISSLSLIYATWMNFSGNQLLNYFDTFSRFWEIGFGALFGYVVMHHLVFSKSLRWILSTIGFSAILLTGVFLDGAQQFPGILTLIPIVGALLVVSAGQLPKTEERNFSNLGPVFLMESKVMKFFGKISYSLYLWHWPILILPIKATGLSSLDPAIFIPVIASSIVLAYLTNRFIEEPFRQKKKPQRASVRSVLSRSYRVRAIRRSPGVIYPVIVVLLTFSAIITSSSPVIFDAGYKVRTTLAEKRINELGERDYIYPGAEAFTVGKEVVESAPLLPDPTLPVSQMMPRTQDDECYSDFSDTEIKIVNKFGKPCEYGDTESEKTLYVIGGSHSEHYMPALEEIAKRRNFKIIPILKMGCPLYQNIKWNGEDYPECIEWSDKVIEYIENNPPEMGIFMTGTRPSGILGDGPEMVPDWYHEASKKISDMGIHQYLVRDNPWMMIENGSSIQKDVRICMSEGHSEEECGEPVEGYILEENPMKDAYLDIPGKTIIDLGNAYIKDGFAHSVVGNIMVYRDSHHMTSQFTRTLNKPLEKQMFPGPYEI